MSKTIEQILKEIRETIEQNKTILFDEVYYWIEKPIPYSYLKYFVFMTRKIKNEINKNEF